MTLNSEVVTTARRIDGVPYVFGAEVRLSDPSPSAFDCSEAVQWILWQTSGVIAAPDGAWNQLNWCHAEGWAAPSADMLTVPGLLCFIMRNRAGVPLHPPIIGARPATSHVGITDGLGYVWEARNPRVGCGRHLIDLWEWTSVYTIPGVTYLPPSLPHPPTKEDPMRFYRTPANDIYVVGFTNLGLRKQHVTTEWSLLVAEEENNLIDATEEQLAGVRGVQAAE